MGYTQLTTVEFFPRTFFLNRMVDLLENNRIWTHHITVNSIISSCYFVAILGVARCRCWRGVIDPVSDLFSPPNRQNPREQQQSALFVIWMWTCHQVFPTRWILKAILFRKTPKSRVAGLRRSANAFRKRQKARRIVWKKVTTFVSNSLKIAFRFGSMTAQTKCRLWLHLMYVCALVPCPSSSVFFAENVTQKSDIT